VDEDKPTLSREIIRISHPIILLASVLFYALGGGIVFYIHGSLRWDIYLLGQLMIFALLLSAYFLSEFYTLPPVPPERRVEPAPVLTRNGLLVVSATALTAGAVLTMILFSDGVLNAPAFLLLGLAFFLTMAYALPPIRLVYSGYGELAWSVLLVNLIPGMAYIFQVGEFHQLLALLTFPLTFLCLAAFLAASMVHYAEDMRLGRKTMLIRMGWQRGIHMHNLFILTGFLLLGSATFAGLPWALTWHGLLGLPFGVFQIVQMNAIAGGAQPRWRILTTTAASTIGLTAYFITLALWTG
jgi:1,4-dihydroxy-2-naphthoate octaprenyltransferase